MNYLFKNKKTFPLAGRIAFKENGLKIVSKQKKGGVILPVVPVEKVFSHMKLIDRFYLSYPSASYLEYVFTGEISGYTFKTQRIDPAIDPRNALKLTVDPELIEFMKTQNEELDLKDIDIQQNFFYNITSGSGSSSTASTLYLDYSKAGIEYENNQLDMISPMVNNSGTFYFRVLCYNQFNVYIPIYKEI